MAEITEMVFDIDNFNKPKILKGVKAKAQLFIDLIMMESGSNPNTPDMGYGLASHRYEFIDDANINKMREDMIAQCAKYLPDLLINDIQVEKYDNRSLLIGVSFENEDGTVNEALISSRQEINSTIIEVLKTL